MAYALGIPSVTLFSTTRPEEWGPPRSPHHQTVTSVDCSMASISVDEVLQAAYQAIRQETSGHAV
jgi:ADP-heptose:LPS heptosyltransferase